MKDKLIIAYPDQTPVIVIRDNATDGVVDRPTTKVDIIIKDQPVSSTGSPTVKATVACLNSGDKVIDVTLVCAAKPAWKLSLAEDQALGDTDTATAAA